MPTIQEIRARYPQTGGMSDADIITRISQAKGIPAAEVATDFGIELPTSNTGKNLAAGWANYKAGLERFGGELTGSDTLNRWADENTARAELLNATSTSVKDTEDIHGLGDAASWLGYNAAQAVPYVGEFLVPGGLAVKASRGLRTGIRAAEAAGDINKANQLKNALSARAVGAGTVASYPSSTGDIMQNMMEQSGYVDNSAYLLGAPYAALNAVSPEAGIAHALIRGLPTMAKGRIANALATGAAASLVGGAQETGQEVFNQYGRNVVDPNYDPFGDQAQRAYRESFLAGAALSGIPGAIGGGLHKPGLTQEEYDARRLQEEQDRLAEEQARAAAEQQAQEEARQQQVLAQQQQAWRTQLTTKYPFSAVSAQVKAVEKAHNEQVEAAKKQFTDEYYALAEQDRAAVKLAEFLKKRMEEEGVPEKMSTAQAYDAFLSRQAEADAKVEEGKRRAGMGLPDRIENQMADIPPTGFIPAKPAEPAPPLALPNYANPPIQVTPGGVALRNSDERNLFYGGNQDLADAGIPEQRDLFTGQLGPAARYSPQEEVDAAPAVPKGQKALFDATGSVTEEASPESLFLRQQQGVRDKQAADAKARADAKAAAEKEAAKTPYQRHYEALDHRNTPATRDAYLAWTDTPDGKRALAVEDLADKAKIARDKNGRIPKVAFDSLRAVVAAEQTDAISSRHALDLAEMIKNRPSARAEHERNLHDAVMDHGKVPTYTLRGGEQLNRYELLDRWKNADPVWRKVVSDLIGYDIDTKEPLAQELTPAEAAAHNGVSKSQVDKIRQKLGISEDALIYALARDWKPVSGAQLALSDQSEGGSALHDAGIQTVDTTATDNNAGLEHADRADKRIAAIRAKRAPTAMETAMAEAEAKRREKADAANAEIEARKAKEAQKNKLRKKVIDAAIANDEVRAQAGALWTKFKDEAFKNWPQLTKKMKDEWVNRLVGEALDEQVADFYDLPDATLERNMADMQQIFEEVQNESAGRVDGLSEAGSTGKRPDVERRSEEAAFRDAEVVSRRNAERAGRGEPKLLEPARQPGDDVAPETKNAFGETVRATEPTVTSYKKPVETGVDKPVGEEREVRLTGAARTVAKELVKLEERRRTLRSTVIESGKGSMSAENRAKKAELKQLEKDIARTKDELEVVQAEEKAKKRGGDDLQFSIADSEAGQQASRLKQTLRSAFSNPYFFDRAVSVVQSEAELPGDVAKDVQSVDGKVKGLYDPKSNKVWLIAGNIAEGQELSVILHEVGVHQGMKNLLGSQNYDALVSKLKEWEASGKGIEGLLARKARERITNAEKRAGKALSESETNNELLAYFVEEAVNAGIDPTAVKGNTKLEQWFRRLWAAVKVAIRKLRMNPEALTAQHVVDMAYGAARMELNAAWHGTAAEFRRFNHDYMGTGEGAQAYGWGTYLAQRVGIGKGYWRQDIARKSSGKPENYQALADASTKASEDLRDLEEGGDHFYSTALNKDYENADKAIEALDAAIQRNKEKTAGYTANLGKEGFSDYGLRRNIDYLKYEQLPELIRDRERALDREPYAVRLQAAKDAYTAAEKARNDALKKVQPEGSLMRVDTNIQDDELLDWDKPLSEQSELVKEAFESSDFSRKNKSWWVDENGNRVSGMARVKANLDPVSAEARGWTRVADSDTETMDQPGSEVYRKLKQKYGSKQAASEYLDSIGIKGIKFLDAASRDKQAEVRQMRQDKFKVSYLDSAHPDWFNPAVAYFKTRTEADAFADKVSGKTRNLVVFNDKNIYRIFSERGANPESRMFSIAAADLAGRIAGKQGRMAVTDFGHAAKKALGNMMFLHDLIDEVKGTMPSIETWYTALQNSVMERNRLEKKAEDIAAMADKLKTDEYTALNDFISRSTFEQKWGYDPQFPDRKVVVDPDMARAFAKLNPELQAIVKAVFAHGEETHAAKKALFKSLGASGLLEGDGKLQGPYAPLKRFGNYVAVLKSQKVLDAEEAYEKDKTAANERRVNELKSNPAEYVQSHFDTKGQARIFAEANASKFALADYFEGSTRVGTQREIDYKTYQRILEATKLDKNMPEQARKAFEDMVRDMLVRSLDDNNARLSGLKRMNRAGYDADMIKSFLHHARADAAFMSNIKYGGAINEAFMKLQQEAKDKDTKLRNGQDVFNLIANHYASNLAYKETPWQDRLTAGVTVWQLSLSLGYHLQNATQPVMVTVPKLASDFSDYSGAWTRLMAGYRMARKLVSIRGGVDLTKLDKTKHAGLLDALLKAENLGVLAIGMEENLNAFDKSRTGYTAFDNTSGAIGGVLHHLRKVAQFVEGVNRVASAVAAYELAKSHGKAEAYAQDYAVKILQSTQGDFTRAGAPLIIKNLPKPTVQYRKYQFMMAALYAKAFRDATMGSTPEQKAVGRRMLGYKLMHTSLAAGVLGWPMANLAAMFFAFSGDDDEPKDLERWLREMIGDDTTANLLLHGPLAALGLDASAKLGDDKIFSIAPYTDFDLTSAAGLGQTAFSLIGGPSAAVAGRMADGVGMLKDGEPYKAIEKFMPKGVADAMQAFRLANEGYTTRNGDVLVNPEELVSPGLLFDALGMPTSEIKLIKWTRGQQYEIEQFYKDRTAQIEHAYRKAAKAGDSETMQEMRQEWMSLQDGKDRVREFFHDNPSALKRQPLSVLLKYPGGAEKREKRAQANFAD